jgi:hypothetical protein
MKAQIYGTRYYLLSGQGIFVSEYPYCYHVKIITDAWKYSCNVKSLQPKERDIQNVDILYYFV